MASKTDLEEKYQDWKDGKATLGDLTEAIQKTLKDIERRVNFLENYTLPDEYRGGFYW